MARNTRGRVDGPRDRDILIQANGADEAPMSDQHGFAAAWSPTRFPAVRNGEVRTPAGAGERAPLPGPLAAGPAIALDDDLRAIAEQARPCYDRLRHRGLTRGNGPK